MTNILLEILIAIFGFSLVVSAIDLRRKKSEEKLIAEAVEKYLKTTIERGVAQMEFFKRSFEGLNHGLKDIGSFLLTEDVMSGAEILGTKVPLTPAIRVYSLLLRKTGTFEQKVYSVPGHTIEEARQLAVAHLGAGWEMIDSSFLDVSVPKAPVETKVETVVKEEKSKGIADFVTYMKYAIDNFTTKKSEKDLLESIITRINKKYDRNSTKKNA